MSRRELEVNSSDRPTLSYRTKLVYIHVGSSDCERLWKIVCDVIIREIEILSFFVKLLPKDKLEVLV